MFKQSKSKNTRPVIADGKKQATLFDFSKKRKLDNNQKPIEKQQVQHDVDAPESTIVVSTLANTSVDIEVLESTPIEVLESTAIESSLSSVVEIERLEGSMGLADYTDLDGYDSYDEDEDDEDDELEDAMNNVNLSESDHVSNRMSAGGNGMSADGNGMSIDNPNGMNDMNLSNDDLMEDDLGINYVRTEKFHSFVTWFCNEMAQACKNVTICNKYAPVGFQMIGNSLILLFETPPKAFTAVEGFPSSLKYIWIPNQDIKVKNGKDVVYRKIIKPQWDKYKSQASTKDKPLVVIESHIQPYDEYCKRFGDQLLETNSVKAKTTVKNKELIEKRNQQYSKQYEIEPIPSGGTKITNITEGIRKELVDLFMTKFKDPSIDYKFLGRGNPLQITSGLESFVTKSLEPGDKTRLTINNNSLVIFNAGIDDLVQQLKKQGIIAKYNKVGNLSAETIDKAWPEVLDARFDLFSVLSDKHRLKKETLGFNESEELFQANTSHFIHWLFIVNKQLVKIGRGSLLKFISDESVIGRYLIDLESIQVFGLKSPNTLRRKIETLKQWISFAKRIGYGIDNIANSHALQRVEFNLSDRYKLTNQKRNEWLQKTHSASFMDNYGILLGEDAFWKTIKGSFTAIKMWVLFWLDDSIPLHQKQRAIRTNGIHFHDNFVYWLISYTFSNRSQFYYQLDLSDLKLFEFLDHEQNRFYQYYLISDPRKTFNKISRSPDENMFAMGIFNSMAILFAIETFYPLYIGGDGPFALAYTPSKSPITAKNSRGRGISQLLERVTKAYTGVGLKNQLFRVHYNSYMKSIPGLSERERIMIDRGMNHSKITADKHYTIMSGKQVSTGNTPLDNNIVEGNHSDKEVQNRKKRMIIGSIDIDSLTIQECEQLYSYSQVIISQRQ